jgi:hypothetical protein
MNELLIGRDLSWIEDGGVSREESPAYRAKKKRA